MTLKDVYLKAAHIPSRPGIYFVGPYGRRVSFSSQQQRALNTIWALEEAGQIQEAFDVAVIGGGLAGITAATALAARRCSVVLYEERPRVLNVQDTTRHRYIHPTVNFWPEKPLEGTTRFPFFDWHEDVCSNVLEQVKREWDGFFKKQLAQVYPSTRVTLVEYVARDADLDKDKVRVTAEGRAPSQKLFDAVVFATGFGVEAEVVGCANNSYWSEDYLPEMCSEDQPVLISGTGDGGLIDALRCVHADFDIGRMPRDLAFKLNETPVKKKLVDLEKKVRDKAGGDENKAAHMYAAGFDAIKSSIPGSVREFLEKSLKHRTRPVRLVGKLPHPYSQEAAPIHKFMIAHAISAGAIAYTQGELTDGPTLKVPGLPDENLAGATCVARHGSKPPLRGLFSDLEIETLRTNQRLLADLLEQEPYPVSHWSNWSDYPDRNPEGIEFARFRYPLAAEYVLRRYKLPLGIRLDKGGGAANYVIFVDPASSTPTKELPAAIFGTPTVVTPAALIDVYAA